MCSTLKDTNPHLFQDAYEWLCNFETYNWIFGLERITDLLKQLGNPHYEIQVIHVAGTNGKGSVCTYISSILQEAGYRVGLYLSPHIERFSERILINKKEISQEDFVGLISHVKPIVEAMKKKKNSPSFFEIVTAIAFLYFKQRSVDYAVVEVGLGGRFDATNVVHPLVSVITNISLEHTDILGKKIGLIAVEKAGIIKDHVPVVSAARDDARVVIKQISFKRNASITWIDETMWKRTFSTRRCQEFTIKGSFKNYNVQTSILGRYQGENIALAIAVIELLQIGGIYLTDRAIQDGIQVAMHPGRMEFISTHPFILLDGAHNSAGIRMLVETIQEDFSPHRCIVVLGILKDKNLKTIISMIIPISDMIIATKSKNLRAADPLRIQEIINTIDIDKPVIVENSIPQAIETAKRYARQTDMICVTGSLFTVGEARGYLLQQNELGDF